MTRREIVDRLECEARRRAQQQAELHRPYWLDDSEDDGDGGPRMFAHVAIYAGLVLVLIALGCRAWGLEDDITAQRTAETVAQMEGR